MLDEGVVNQITTPWLDMLMKTPSMAVAEQISHATKRLPTRIIKVFPMEYHVKTLTLLTIAKPVGIML